MARLSDKGGLIFLRTYDCAYPACAKPSIHRRSCQRRHEDYAESTGSEVRQHIFSIRLALALALTANIHERRCRWKPASGRAVLPLSQRQTGLWPPLAHLGKVFS